MCISCCRITEQVIYTTEQMFLFFFIINTWIFFVFLPQVSDSFESDASTEPEIEEIKEAAEEFHSDLGQTDEDVEEFLDDVDFSNQDVEAVEDELLAEAD